MIITAPNVLAQVRHHLQGDVKGLMLFGSMARGEVNSHSDIDLLQLTERYQPSYRVGTLNVAVYTPASLERIASEGSLFALHLVEEGIVLEDCHGTLSRTLSQYRPPVSYEVMFDELRLAVDLLNVSQDFYNACWDRCNRLSLFLLRSVLYARAARAGRPLFCVSRIAKQLCDERITQVYQLKYCDRPDPGLFRLCTELMHEYLDSTFMAEKDATESIVVNAYGRSRLTVNLGLRLLGVSDAVGYAGCE